MKSAAKRVGDKGDATELTRLMEKINVARRQSVLVRQAVLLLNNGSIA